MINQQLFNRANRALAEGNYEEFITYCRDDIQWENVGNRIFNGKPELLMYISSAYEGTTFTTERSIQENDVIVELGQIIFEKDDKSKKSSYCDVWYFRDGLISKVTSFVI